MLIAVSDKLHRQTDNRRSRSALFAAYTIRLRQSTTYRLVARSIITRFPRNLDERMFISFLDGAPLLRKPLFATHWGSGGRSQFWAFEMPHFRGNVARAIHLPVHR
jgi:hypothetical protein